MLQPLLKKLTILHSNDMHGDFLPHIDENGREKGGLPRLSGYVNKIRETRENVIYANAGDILFREVVPGNELRERPKLRKQNLLWVMLNPARLRVYLRKGTLNKVDHVAVVVDKYRSRRGRALVEGHYVTVHILMLLFF